MFRLLLVIAVTFLIFLLGVNMGWVPLTMDAVTTSNIGTIFLGAFQGFVAVWTALAHYFGEYLPSIMTYENAEWYSPAYKEDTVYVVSFTIGAIVFLVTVLRAGAE